jgi:hypothetical protein
MKNCVRFINSSTHNKINKKEVLLNKHQFYLEELDKVLKI